MDKPKNLSLEEADELRMGMIDSLGEVIKKGNILMDDGKGDFVTSSLIVIANFIIVIIAKMKTMELQGLIDVIVKFEKERAEREGDLVTKEIIKSIENEDKTIIH